MKIKEYTKNLNGKELSIAIVQSRFNGRFCENMLRACIEQLESLGVTDEKLSVITVPGALEIPIVLKKLARTRQFHVLVAIGVIIRGETYHFEIVSNESSKGISRIIYDYDLPIVNAILTTENEEQTEARVLDKGRTAAQVAVEMGNLAKLCF